MNIHHPRYKNNAHTHIFLCRYRNTSDLYKRLKEVNELQASLCDLRGEERKAFLSANKEKLETKKILVKVSSSLRRLRKRRGHVINNYNISWMERQKVLDAIQEKMNRLSQRAVERTGLAL